MHSNGPLLPSQYLVQWTSYGPKHDCWLAGFTLANYKALNIWLGKGDSGIATW